MSEPTIYKPSIYNGNGVYNNGGGGGGGDLPAEYEQCNYIESDGTAYLYAQISHAQTNTLRSMSAKYSPVVKNDNNKYLFFAVRNYGFGGYSAFGVQNTDLLFVVSGQIFGDSNSEYLNFVEQKMIGSSGTTISSNYTTDKVLGNNILQSFDRVYLFRFPDEGTISAGKFFGAKFRNENENKDIIDFIPAKRISDGVYGVWENVGKNFYSAYTGSFTGG